MVPTANFPSLSLKHTYCTEQEPYWGSCTYLLFSLNDLLFGHKVLFVFTVSEGCNSCILLNWRQSGSVILHNKVKAVFVAHWFSTSESRAHFTSDLGDIITLCTGSKLNMSQLDMKIVATLIACWTVVKLVVSITCLVMPSRGKHPSCMDDVIECKQINLGKAFNSHFQFCETRHF